MALAPTPSRAASADLRVLVLTPLLYVPKGGWPRVLDLLAGGKPELRSTDGTPNATLISTIAGLDRSQLTMLKLGRQQGMGKKVMEALVTFMINVHGWTRETAEAELWDLIENADAKPVAA
jgi:hypothetical protein